MWNKLTNYLFKPVDIASLVFFRVAFGFIMIIEVFRYWFSDWIPRYYIDPLFHFKYYGFSWVEPWAGMGMYWHFIALGVVSFMIMVGWYYRFATIAFFFLFSYVFLLDQTQYLNHFYFVILLAGLLCVTPAHKAFSIDARRKPSIHSSTIPAWAVVVFILQMEVMYIFAGLVKINSDWLQLQPLTMWLVPAHDWPIIGPLLQQTWGVAVASYGSIILHVFGAPLLLFKRTRIWIFLAYATFHTSNHFLFHIGIFPWLTLVGTLIFFDPSWPRIVYAKLKAWFSLQKNTSVISKPAFTHSATQIVKPSQQWQALLVSLIAVWLAFQVLFPLRHLLYPGTPSWTEEGHRFAWQMKLRDKHGTITFILRDPKTDE